jgi:hypothetical protein
VIDARDRQQRKFHHDGQIGVIPGENRSAVYRFRVAVARL